MAAVSWDVRGALEAGVAVVRLVRPGHELDPEEPSPAYEARTIAELGPLLDRAAVG
jgi:2-haloacid dehalogenase